METNFNEFGKHGELFSHYHACKIAFPATLQSARSHLDPDFSYLTYGDNADARGARLTKLVQGDHIVFYAGLWPIRPCSHKLIYAIIGSYVVDHVIAAEAISQDRWQENAHSRKSTRGHDIVVRAIPERSGRLTKCLPIGEYRDRAYRVRKDLLDDWGGLSAKDGFIQRSAVPPFFNHPDRFLKWYEAQGPQWIRKNN